MYADLKVEGPFTKDPAGSVAGYDLVGIGELNDRINYGLVGNRIVEKVRTRFKK